MSKIAIVTDSNSGITQAQAEELGIYVLPMPFMIGGETYFEGINLSQEEFYEKLRTGVSVSTSQPTPDSVLRLWRRLLLDYDEIVHSKTEKKYYLKFMEQIKIAVIGLGYVGLPLARLFSVSYTHLDVYKRQV